MDSLKEIQQKIERIQLQIDELNNPKLFSPEERDILIDGYEIQLQKYKELEKFYINELDVNDAEDVTNDVKL